MAVLTGLIAAGAAIGGAAISAKSQKKGAQTAAETQIQVTDKNNALAREARDQNIGYLSPWMDVGKSVNPLIQGALGIGDTAQTQGAFDTFRNSTGYDFRMNEGMNALASNFRARGVSQSGAADKALLKFGQDYGSNEFGGWFNRLAGQQGVGLSAANALAGVGTNYAGMVGQNNQNAADATSNAAIARANANSGIYSTAANALGNLAGSAFGSSYGGGNTGSVFSRGAPMSSGVPYAQGQWWT